MNIVLPSTHRVDAVTPMPWKNGGGVTRELFTWPSSEAWRVRVSVADIDESGMFSAFPGVERYFAVLEGEGVALEGVGVVRAGGDPLKFEGDAARHCELLNGKTRDLNLMIRRDAGYGLLRIVRDAEDQILSPKAAIHGLLLWPSGTFTIDVGDNALHKLSPQDRASERVYHFAFWLHGATAA